MRPGLVLPLPDYCNYNSGVRGLYVGGNYNNGDNAGLFYLNGNNAPSNTNSNLGSRLLIPRPRLRVVFSSPLGENFAAGTRLSKPLMDLKGREVNKKIIYIRKATKTA